jgi:hypothetical protein
MRFFHEDSQPTNFVHLVCFLLGVKTEHIAEARTATTFYTNA